MIGEMSSNSIQVRNGASGELYSWKMYNVEIFLEGVSGELL